MPRGAGNYRRFTEAEKQRMREMRVAGKTVAEIAREMGDGYTRVRDWFKMSRDAWEPPKPRPATESPISRDGFIAPPTRAQLMGRR